MEVVRWLRGHTWHVNLGKGNFVYPVELPLLIGKTAQFSRKEGKEGYRSGLIKRCGIYFKAKANRKKKEFQLFVKTTTRNKPKLNQQKRCLAK